MTRGVKGLVVGIVLVIAGVVLDGAGVMLWSTVDADGRIVVPVGVIEAGGARTLVVDIDRYAAAPPGLESFGRTRLAVVAHEKVLLAVGNTTDVDGALRGSTYVAANAAGTEWQVAEVPGQGRPVDLARQTFWWTLAQGETPEIEIPESRPATVVITGPAGLGTVQLSAVFVVHDSQIILAILGGVGFALILAGALMIVLWLRRGRRNSATS